MEEEKLAKDINILSKDDTEIDVGMTDEEIVKALECCKQNEIENTCAYCLDCPASDCDWADDEIGECVDGLYQATINLIHRLQGENAWQKAEIELLTEEHERIAWSKQQYLDWVHGFLTTHTDMKNRGEDYKMFDRDWMCGVFWAKIEGSIEYIIDLENQRNELQKQVDELKAKQVIECHGMLKGCDIVKQAVNATAKEIFDELYHKNYEIDIEVEDYELHEKAIEIVSKAMLKALNERMKAVAERYGVEVE